MKRRITRKTSKRIGRFTAVIALLLICSILICGCQETGITETSSVVISQTSELPEIPHKKEMISVIGSNDNENQHIMEIDEFSGNIYYNPGPQKVEDILKGYVDAGIDKVTITFTDKYITERRPFCSTTTDKAAIDELFDILTELEFNYGSDMSEINLPKAAENAHLAIESQGVAYEIGHGILALSYAEDYPRYEPYATVANDGQELEDLKKRMISFLERMEVEPPAEAMKLTLETTAQ